MPELHILPRRAMKLRAELREERTITFCRFSLDSEIVGFDIKVETIFNANPTALSSRAHSLPTSTYQEPQSRGPEYREFVRFSCALRRVQNGVMLTICGHM